MEMKTGEGKALWIDCAKFVAMIAVIVDHMQTIAFFSPLLVCVSRFSVTVFILLSGITSYYSIQKHLERRLWLELKRRVLAILLPYFCATFLYQILFERSFHFDKYLLHLIKFDAAGPLYFVAFYVQLIIVAPLLFQLLQSCNRVKHPIIGYIVLFAGAVLLSIFSINRTMIFDAYGGAQYLLGGTYYFIFSIGMLFAHLKIDIAKTKNTIYWLIGTAFICFLCLAYMVKSQFAIDRMMPFGNGQNPPGLLLMCYSLLVFAILFLFFSLMEKNSNAIIRKIITYIGHLGQYTLYIFLYHELILRVVRYFLNLCGLGEMRGRIFIYLPAMVYCPIIMWRVYDAAKRRLFSDGFC